MWAKAPSIQLPWPRSKVTEAPLVRNLCQQPLLHHGEVHKQPWQGLPVIHIFVLLKKKKIKAALCAVIMKTHFLWMHVLRSNSLASNKCQFPLQLFPRLGTPLSHVDSLMSNKGCTHAAAFLSMGPLIRSPSSIKTACFHETRRNIASLRLRASPLPSSLAETG